MSGSGQSTIWEPAIIWVMSISLEVHKARAIDDQYKRLESAIEHLIKRQLQGAGEGGISKYLVQLILIKMVKWCIQTKALDWTFDYRGMIEQDPG